MLRSLIILILALFMMGCSGKKKYNEQHYQSLLCSELGGEMEYVLKDKTRVDCLTDEYAIEIDFAKKWAEAIGQSLHYAHMTEKKPAIGFIVNSKKDKRHLNRMNVMADRYGIKVFVIDKY